MRVRGGWPATLTLLFCGCVSFSPPVRGLPGGMPDRVAHHELELGGSAGSIFRGNGNGVSFLPPTIGGPHVAYGVLDFLVLEAGVNLELVYLHWATHWFGARFVHRQPLGNWRFSADAEFGAGAGGANLKTTREFVFGAYSGGGVGFRWHWLGFFARARLDLGQAGTLQPNLWPTLVAGAEARAGDVVVISLGGGMAGMWSRGTSFIAFGLLQLSISLVFDLQPRAAEGRGK